jgi:hypothetical protein
MSLTDPSPPAEFTPAILDEMAETFMSEYEQKYYAAYLRAVMARDNRRPFEPTDELRNAFDHFSLATRGAFDIDGRNPPKNPREREVPPQKDALAPKERAFVDLDQGRRHLVIGRYYCAEHQIIGLMERIAQTLKGMSPKDRRAKAPLRQRAAEIDAKFQGMKRIVIEPIFTRKEIAAWITDLETKIEELTTLTLELGTLYKAIARPRRKAKRA